MVRHVGLILVLRNLINCFQETWPKDPMYFHRRPDYSESQFFVNQLNHLASKN